MLEGREEPEGKAGPGGKVEPADDPETGQGVQGIQGHPGVQGIQGIQGPPGLIEGVADLADVVGALRSEVAAERRDRRKSVRRLVWSVAGALAIAIVAFGSGVLVAYDRIDGRVDRNSANIARTQYEICTTRNAATRRQNALIDSAIAAEKRKPHPDAKRLRDLENFKGATPSCGPKP